MADKDLLRVGIRQLQKLKHEMPGDWEMIEQYLVTGGAISLTDEQKQTYDRWQFVDEKLRQSKYRRYEIVEMVATRFGVSKETARRDLIGCEMVFSSSYPLNKKYFISTRINFLERMINLAAANNDHKAVSEYEKLLEKYIAQYPDSTAPRSPKKIVFVLNQNLIQSETVPVEDAVAIIQDKANQSDDE